jgi:hypothetical protein
MTTRVVVAVALEARSASRCERVIEHWRDFDSILLHHCIALHWDRLTLQCDAAASGDVPRLVWFLFLLIEAALRLSILDPCKVKECVARESPACEFRIISCAILAIAL